MVILHKNAYEISDNSDNRVILRTNINYSDKFTFTSDGKLPHNFIFFNNCKTSYRISPTWNCLQVGSSC